MIFRDQLVYDCTLTWQDKVGRKDFDTESQDSLVALRQIRIRFLIILQPVFYLCIDKNSFSDNITSKNYYLLILKEL